MSSNQQPSEASRETARKIDDDLEQGIYDPHYTAALIDADKAPLVELIAQVEWVEVDPVASEECPLCKSAKEQGHTADCGLAALLASHRPQKQEGGSDG